MKTQLEALKTKYTGSDLRREVTALIYKLSGPDNRFKRQALYRELTGENILVAQAGVNRLTDAAMRFLTAESGKVVFMDTTDEQEQETPAAQESAAVELTIECGLLVIRKACKRTGVVQEIDNDKVKVLLSDGSVRKPNRERFLKLYQRQ